MLLHTSYEYVPFNQYERNAFAYKVTESSVSILCWVYNVYIMKDSIGNNLKDNKFSSFTRYFYYF